MQFGVDTYALSVDLLDRFLATLKVLESSIDLCSSSCSVTVGSSEVLGMLSCGLSLRRS